jgi:hypothetical protein
LGGNQKLGQQVEDGGFARAVGPDQGVDLSSFDAKVHAVDGNKTLELFDEAPGFKNDFVSHWVLYQDKKENNSSIVGLKIQLPIHGYPDVMSHA